MRFLIKKLIKKRILNNSFINPLLQLLKLDATLNDMSQDYVDFKPDTTKSLQEIAGYSIKPEINSTLQSIHTQLITTINEHQLKDKSEDYSILDVGCGPGLYLMNFKGKAKLTGIDISQAMCLIAKKEVPEAEILNKHFLDYTFSQQYNAIYSIGVLIYFSRTQVENFFNKIYQLLKPNGLAFISYPHAFRAQDLKYSDYTYVHYSPDYLNQIVSSNFEIVHHLHQDGKTKIQDYDKNPLIISGNYDNRSYYNSSILILKKK